MESTLPEESVEQRPRRRQVVFVFLASGLFILFWLLLVSAESPAVGVEEVLPDEEVANPHFHKDHCKACHANGRPAKMKLRQIEDLCNSCHRHEKNRTEIHPSRIASHKGAVQNVPTDFPLIKRELTCSTCHDAFIQCTKDRDERGKNPLFLRGGPFADPSDICFRCHDAGLYDVFNPHDHRDPEGRLKEELCLYCHNPPDLSRTPEAVVGEPFVDICKSCHRMGKHPTGIDHMLKPSRKMRAYIIGVSKRNKLYIPLNARDEIYCSTCHNPHAEGIFPEGEVRSLGAGDDPGRHRVRVAPERICTVCHDRKTYHGNSASHNKRGF